MTTAGYSTLFNPARQPVAVIRSIAQRREVIDCSPPAESQGVRVGHTEAEARSLCPGIVLLPDDPAGDRKSLDTLGRWMTRFTPVVCSGWDDDETSPAPAALFLDLTGSERLFGGIAPLVDRVQWSMTRLSIPAKIALASTLGAAWALAITNPARARIINPEKLRTALLPMSVSTLRLAPRIIADLHHLGLRAIGDLLALDRNDLPARFGPTLLKRLDQLTGDLPEPLAGLVYEVPITTRLEFDSPVDAMEHLWLIYEKLLGQVLSDLTRRNHGARQLRLILTPDRGWGLPTITRLIDLSRPHRRRPTLLNLLRNEIERIDCTHGFVRFQLDVPLHESVADEQVQLFDQQQAENERELDRLIERLRSRLSADAVIQPKLVESYLPERAWAADLDGTKLAVVPTGGRVSSPAASRDHRKFPAAEDSRPPDGVGRFPANASEGVITLVPPRPLTLLPTPVEVRVICEPSDDRTGRPRQFTWQGIVHRLAHVVGPERIAGEWWRGHKHTRDYYDAQDVDGERFWLFRVLHFRSEDDIPARWFVHGGF